MAILQVEKLTFRYPESEKEALCGMTFSVEPGEFIVICGDSGCGKTTLLRLLKRELAPSGEKSGRIFYDGCLQEQLDKRTACTEIGLVQQKPESQIVTDKVWHELAFGLESLGLPSSVIRRRVAEMAAYFGVESWFRQSTMSLSGGQKQLLNLASVVVMQPKLLLLDEPTAQLDPIAAADFISTLQKLNRELGLTILLAEHRLEETLPIADRVFWMDGGTLRFSGGPRKLITCFKAAPESSVAAGMPAAVRIYHALGGEGDCPLTVREGHRFIAETYNHNLRSLPKKPVDSPAETVMALKHVWFRYEKEQPDVLRDLSISVYKGEHLGVLGGNGAGKTTLLGLLAGVQKPYRGQVTLEGKKLSAYGQKALYRQNIALLPQDPQTVFSQKTVKEDLLETGLETGRVMAYGSAETERLLVETAERVGITPLLDKHPYDLSGGEQQKAALAKLLLLKPKILLLDEPTKGLDACYKRQLAALLRSLQADGVTVVTVTHDVEFAAAHVDRCAFVFDGEIVSVDTPNAFLAGNTFYTTAANRIARGCFEGAVLCEEVAELCRLNGRKETLYE